MLYNYSSLFPTSPIICSPLPVLPMPVAPSTIPSMNTDPSLINNLQINQENVINNTNIIQMEHNKTNTPSTPQFQRPASQATSVKAEPGSAMGSIASASVANKVKSKHIFLYFSISSIFFY